MVYRFRYIYNEKRLSDLKGVFCGDSRSRTDDFLLAKQAL